MNWLIVFVGGGLGSVLRYGTGKMVHALFGEMRFPLATFLSNLVSCLIFSFALIWILPRVQSQSTLQLFLLTGICGGYSTFSTFSFETFQLIQRQEYVLAAANITINLLCCIGLFMLLAKKLNG